MRIKKTSEAVPRAGHSVNTYSDSTTDAYACDYINDCNDYSTSETYTGKHWIDGEKIYRKCFTITAQDTLHNIQNFKEIISYSAVVYQNNLYGRIECANDVVVQGNKFYLKGVALDNVANKILVILEYTKNE